MQEQPWPEQNITPFYLGDSFTPEEEDREVNTAIRFYRNFPGHPRTHTLKVIHDDGRQYYVHIDCLERR